MLIKFTKRQLQKIESVKETAVKYGEVSPIFLKPADIKSYVSAFEATLDALELDKERFYVFGLDTRNGLKFMDIVSTGTLNHNLVHPREVFRPAIIVGCASVIIAHNHPAGSLSPSDKDIALTKRLVSGGKLLGIGLLDHVIISKEGFSSFKEKGLI